MNVKKWISACKRGNPQYTAAAGATSKPVQCTSNSACQRSSPQQFQCISIGAKQYCCPATGKLYYIVCSLFYFCCCFQNTSVVTTVVVLTSLFHRLSMLVVMQWLVTLHCLILDGFTTVVQKLARWLLIKAMQEISTVFTPSRNAVRSVPKVFYLITNVCI